MTRVRMILRSIRASETSIDWFSDAGRFCRVCRRGIDRADPFGVSEGVCAACRASA